jgi:diguanylate cyclase (GGDEF)-like protein
MGILFFGALLLLGLGVVLLIASLYPIKQIITHLPHGKLRRRWYLLAGLNLFFLLGYISYGIVFGDQIQNMVDLIVPCIFFLGACFVWLISSLSLQTAIDVRRVSLLEKENITDPLTGIYNRRYMERRLEEEFFHARRSDSPLSILLVDIDHFKQINDTYGHPVGDLVLSYLAKLMLDFIRGSDILARFGGDEFVIIVFNTPPSAAAAFAARIIRHVESHELTISSEQKSHLEIKSTVSIGVAGLAEDVTDIQHLFRNADEALYCAKSGGRNCSAVYPCLKNKEQ